MASFFFRSFVRSFFSYIQHAGGCTQLLAVL
jgi:hypothetical protein